LSPFKWLSIVIGGVCFACVMAMLAITFGPAWRMAGGHWIDLGLVSGAAAMVVGAVLWLAAATFDREYRQAVAAAHAGISIDGSTRVTPGRGLFGLSGIVAALADTVATLQTRLREAIVGRRDLDARLSAAQEQRWKLDQVVHAIDLPILVTDGFNELVFANAAAADLLGFSLHSAIRKPIEQVVSDQAVVRLIRDAREAARTTPRLRRQVQHRLRQPGVCGVFQVTLQALAAEPVGGDGGADDSARGVSGGIVTMLRDVTQQAQNAERRTEFVASVSHELRTPLASIKGCLEMLMDGEATDAATASEFYGIIHTETNRLSRLVDNILNISRIESGATQSHRERFDLDQLVEETVLTFTPQARAKRIDLGRGPSSAAPVIGDRDMIGEAIGNLLSNAIKYTLEGGRVDVAVRTDPGQNRVSVAVSDTGIGIPADALPFVWDKFYRVSDHVRVAKGTGLGLNLVKHVIEGVHGGQVAAESVAGQGSTFTLTLPIAENCQRDPNESALRLARHGEEV
jgi:signal transduction histidine kinase